MIIYIIFRSISWSLADPFNGFVVFVFTAGADGAADDCAADVDCTFPTPAAGVPRAASGMPPPPLPLPLPLEDVFSDRVIELVAVLVLVLVSVSLLLLPRVVLLLASSVTELGAAVSATVENERVLCW
jgi:hypothetical protein